MLTMKNITKSFLGNPFPTLKGINLQFTKGEFCVLIGSNGSGKSTLLKCLSGEYQADDKSEFYVDSKILEDYEQSKMIAYVTQETHKGTILEMTLLENMILSDMRIKAAKLQFYNNKKQIMINRLKKLNMGLENHINAPLASLSGGQRQMVATIMAINSEPKILLLDEHTSALDPKSQVLLMEYSQNAIRSQQLTTIMITHRLDDAVKYGDRIIMMHQGEIVMDVSGDAKKELSVEQLLCDFHRFEDLILTAGITK